MFCKVLNLKTRRAAGFSGWSAGTALYLVGGFAPIPHTHDPSGRTFVLSVE